MGAAAAEEQKNSVDCFAPGFVLVQMATRFFAPVAGWVPGWKMVSDDSYSALVAA